MNRSCGNLQYVPKSLMEGRLVLRKGRAGAVLCRTGEISGLNEVNGPGCHGKGMAHQPLSPSRKDTKYCRTSVNSTELPNDGENMGRSFPHGDQPLLALSATAGPLTHNGKV